MDKERRPNKRNSTKENKKFPYKKRREVKNELHNRTIKRFERTSGE